MWGRIYQFDAAAPGLKGEMIEVAGVGTASRLTDPYLRVMYALPFPLCFVLSPSLCLVLSWNSLDSSLSNSSLRLVANKPRLIICFFIKHIVSSDKY